MAEAEYCDDCHRIVGVGCECGLTFSQKVRSRNVRYGGWAPSKEVKWAPPSGGDD